MGFHDTHHDHSHCASALITRAETLCAARKTRLTPQRRSVLALIAANHTAVSAYDLVACMAVDGERPAPITVYRALDFLVENGLVHKIESRAAYVACSHDHAGAQAAILVCDGCDSVAEFAALDAFRALHAQAIAQGFAVSKVVVEVSGRCAACA
jgi:Fur family transcriptional regulator, zinc uptake regulator